VTGAPVVSAANLDAHLHRTVAVQYRREQGDFVFSEGKESDTRRLGFLIFQIGISRRRPPPLRVRDGKSGK
jgi:hypothetical protein